MGCWLRPTADTERRSAAGRIIDRIRKFTPSREDETGGARRIPTPHPTRRRAMAQRSICQKLLLGGGLLFLRFLHRFFLLCLGRLVLLGDNRPVNGVDVYLVNASFPRNRDIVRVNQLPVLALQLAGLDGPVRDFLERSRARGRLGDLCFLLERCLSLDLSGSLVRLGGRPCLRCRLGGALVRGTLCTGDGGGSSDGDGHGYHFQHASSSICLTAARVDRGS